MGKDIFSYGDLLQIVVLIKSSEGFSEFHMKVGEIELHLRRAGDASPPPAPAEAPAPASAATLQLPPVATGQGPARSKPVAANFPPNAVIIKSPMVGTFYRKPEPGAKPFIELGQNVAADTTVCIIEVMKLFNSIPAGHAGIVTHILVDDAEAVDLGQVLVVIEPAN